MGNTQMVHDFVIEGNILYIAHGTNGYSDGAGYQTGYITAFDMENHEIVWTTQPMTCNSGFAIVGNSIICGYGMTSEPDYLYVVDKYSGQRLQKLPVKKAVDYVVPKNGKAYVRTYSYDYVFKMQ
jgi:outer membrane protein assembly factor BamB